MTAPAAEPVTTNDIAGRFGVDQRTVRYWIKDGMPAEKAGNPPRWQISPDAALPWIAVHATSIAGRSPIPGLAEAIATAAATGEDARNGQWEIVLTPTRPVPTDWFPPLLAGPPCSVSPLGADSRDQSSQRRARR